MATPSTARIVPGATGRVVAGSISKENYAYLQQQIYTDSGIVLDADKHYLLESRLTPIVRAEHLSSLDDLSAKMRGDAQLRKQVVEAMTTNETLFFRDASPFEALKAFVIPKLKEQRQATRKLNIWSAASSSGQEAYSLAMMLLEMGMGNWSINILGTDLSEQILDRARAGKYMQIEVNRGLPAPLLVKYFRRDGIDWQLKDEVRKMVRFQAFDLRKKMSGLGMFDIVMCRNVLIYFDVPTKKQILAEIRTVMQRGGYLILGGAETTVNLDDSFQRTPIGQAVLYRLV